MKDTGVCLKKFIFESKTQMNTIDSDSSTRRSNQIQKNRNLNISEEIKKEMMAKLAAAFVITEKGNYIIDSYKSVQIKKSEKDKKPIKLLQPPLKLISLKPYKMTHDYKKEAKEKLLSMRFLNDADTNETYLMKRKKVKISKKYLKTSFDDTVNSMRKKQKKYKYNNISYILYMTETNNEITSRKYKHVLI